MQLLILDGYQLEVGRGVLTAVAPLDHLPVDVLRHHQDQITPCRRQPGAQPWTIQKAKRAVQRIAGRIAAITDDVAKVDHDA